MATFAAPRWGVRGVASSAPKSVELSTLTPSAALVVAKTSPSLASSPAWWPWAEASTSMSLDTPRMVSPTRIMPRREGRWGEGVAGSAWRAYAVAEAIRAELLCGDTTREVLRVGSSMSDVSPSTAAALVHTQAASHNHAPVSPKDTWGNAHAIHTTPKLSHIHSSSRTPPAQLHATPAHAQS